MEVNDQKEKKALEKEEDFRGYLIKCENAIKALGNIDFSANDEYVILFFFFLSEMVYQDDDAVSRHYHPWLVLSGYARARFCFWEILHQQPRSVSFIFTYFACWTESVVVAIYFSGNVFDFSCMTMRQLTDIIKKVKPNNPTVKFPKEQTDGIGKKLCKKLCVARLK